MGSAITAALSAVLGYFWLAAYVWTFIPQERDAWWWIPSLFTTVLLAILVYAGTASYFIDRGRK